MSEPTAATAARVKADPPDRVDVAIIGAGPSGLTAGAFLAAQGLSVACFDGHYVAGGCVTQFRRGRKDSRYHFDVGLHYIGDCGTDGMIPTLLRGVGAQVDFAAMDPDGFDELVFPDLRFAIPVGHDRYRQRLLDAFPAEKKGINRYTRFLVELDKVARMTDRTGGKTTAGVMWKVVTGGRLVARYQNATLAQVLDDCTTDPRLRAVIAGQNGDYALPPSKVAAVLHAGLSNHYLRGAYYPKGGGQVISDALAERLEAAGGGIYLRRTVEKVLIEDGRAVGVTLAAKRGQEARQIRAGVVLSGADYQRTLLELVGPEHLPSDLVTKTTNHTLPAALFMTCLGVTGEIPQMRASNYWQFDSFDFEASYRAIDDGPPKTFCAYITSATHKDPDNAAHHAPAGVTSVEVMSLVTGDFKQWGVSEGDLFRRGYRGDARYEDLKARLQDDLIARLEGVFPGTRARVCFAESATPVTHTRYTRASGGTGYGLACTPEQFLAKRPGFRGPIPGLFLCGASTRSGHGVVGAMSSGYLSAKRVARELNVTLPALPWIDA
ncbi:MAG: all-trans-retinol 13,14-reductase [Myxococcota bacterium]